MEFINTKDKRTQKLKFDSQKYQFEYTSTDGRSTSGSIGKLRRAKIDETLSSDEKRFINGSLLKFDNENRKDSNWVNTYIRFDQAEYKVELNNKSHELRIECPSLIMMENGDSFFEKYEQLYVTFYDHIFEEMHKFSKEEIRCKSEALDSKTNESYLEMHDFKVDDFEFSIGYRPQTELYLVHVKARTIIDYHSHLHHNNMEFRTLHNGYLRFHIDKFVKTQMEAL